MGETRGASVKVNRNETEFFHPPNAIHTVDSQASSGTVGPTA